MLIQSQNVWIDERFQKAQIEIQNGKILTINTTLENEIDVDYQDAFILPGFIDIHTHGGYGTDVNHLQDGDLKNWCKKLPFEGVTSFLPTTMSAKDSEIKDALHHIASYANQANDGARILGIHLEGPYLDPDYRGAHPEEYLKKASIEDFESYQKAANGLIKILTIAPECDQEYALIEYASKHGVICSLGHSSLTFKEAQASLSHGISSITHTYNAQSPFRHRENGIVGLALYQHDLFSEIICDMVHSTKEALHIFFTCKDKDHALMISDSLASKGYPVGYQREYETYTVEIREDKAAYIKGTNTIAGSIMKINEGLKNLITSSGVDLVKAINSCTINPARLLHLDDHLGLLKENYDADITVLNQNYQVIDTYCKGIKQEKE